MTDFPNSNRLHQFVTSFADVLDRATHESTVMGAGSKLLAALVTHDDWLPSEFAESRPDRYQQYLLHCDSAERFCVVAFVWGPGQSTPVHDHGVWGMVGVLRGAEISQQYRLSPGQSPAPFGEPRLLEPGDVECIGPSCGDIHQVANAFANRVSISIHVYGTNIGQHQRTVYTDEGPKPFVSGYSNAVCPNFWGL